MDTRSTSCSFGENFQDPRIRAVHAELISATQDYTRLLLLRENKLVDIARISAISMRSQTELGLQSSIQETISSLTQMSTVHREERVKSVRDNIGHDIRLQMIDTQEKQMNAVCSQIIGSVRAQRSIIAEHIRRETVVFHQITSASFQHPQSVVYPATVQPRSVVHPTSLQQAAASTVQCASAASSPSRPTRVSVPVQTVSARYTQHETLFKMSESLVVYMSETLKIAFECHRVYEMRSLIEDVMLSRISIEVYQSRASDLLRRPHKDDNTPKIFSRYLNAIKENEMVQRVIDDIDERFSKHCDTLADSIVSPSRLKQLVFYQDAIACNATGKKVRPASIDDPGLVVSDEFAEMLSRVTENYISNIVKHLFEISTHREMRLGGNGKSPLDVVSAIDKLAHEKQMSQKKIADLKRAKSDKGRLASLREAIKEEKLADMIKDANQIAMSMFSTSRKRKSESQTADSTRKKMKPANGRALLVIYVKQEPVDPSLGPAPTVFEKSQEMDEFFSGQARVNIASTALTPDKEASKICKSSSVKQQQKSKTSPDNDNEGTVPLRKEPESRKQCIRLCDVKCMAELNPGLIPPKIKYVLDLNSR
jgi:hypothetical protein